MNAKVCDAKQYIVSICNEKNQPETRPDRRRDGGCRGMVARPSDRMRVRGPVQDGYKACIFSL